MSSTVTKICDVMADIHELISYLDELHRDLLDQAKKHIVDLKVDLTNTSEQFVIAPLGPVPEGFTMVHKSKVETIKDPCKIHLDEYTFPNMPIDEFDSLLNYTDEWANQVSGGVELLYMESPPLVEKYYNGKIAMLLMRDDHIFYADAVEHNDKIVSFSSPGFKDTIRQVCARLIWRENADKKYPTKELHDLELDGTVTTESGEVLSLVDYAMLNKRNKLVEQLTNLGLKSVHHD